MNKTEDKYPLPHRELAPDEAYRSCIDVMNDAFDRIKEVAAEIEAEQEERHRRALCRCIRIECNSMRRLAKQFKDIGQKDG